MQDLHHQPYCEARAANQSSLGFWVEPRNPETAKLYTLNIPLRFIGFALNPYPKPLEFRVYPEPLSELFTLGYPESLKFWALPI